MCDLQDCRPLAATALGRAVAATVLVADGLEQEETFQVRFVGDGPLRGVFAVSTGALEARGYVGNPQVDLSPQGVAAGIGRGQLQVVRLKALPGEEDLSTYSSVVEIKSGEIAEDINFYVATSEQREGALSAGVTVDDATGLVDCPSGIYLLGGRESDLDSPRTSRDRDVDIPKTGRGAAAAMTWIFRGDGRRGRPALKRSSALRVRSRPQVDACAGWRAELLPGAPQDVADHLIRNVQAMMRP